MKKIKTLRFGELEEDESKIIHFAQGMPAFEGEHEFVLILPDMDSPYVFLQSVQTPELALILLSEAVCNFRQNQRLTNPHYRLILCK